MEEMKTFKMSKMMTSSKIVVSSNDYNIKKKTITS